MAEGEMSGEALAELRELQRFGVRMAESMAGRTPGRQMVVVAAMIDAMLDSTSGDSVQLRGAGLDLLVECLRSSQRDLAERALRESLSAPLDQPRG